MKVLYIISNRDLDPRANTGYGRHIRETVSNLQDLGTEVLVFSSLHGRVIDPMVSPHGQSISNAEQTGKRTWIKKLVPPILWQTLRDVSLIRHERRNLEHILAVIQSEEVDIVFERSSYMSSSGYKASKLSGKPYYLEVNSPFVEQRIALSGRSLLNAYAHRIEVEKGRALTKGYCVSQVLVDFYGSRYGYNTKALKSIPNAVEESWLDRPVDKQDNAEVVIGFVGSIMAYHGVDMLLQAFRNAAESLGQIRLLIVGDGHMLETYKDWVRENQLDDKVHFTGSVPFDRVPQQIAKMDICVNPKHSWYGSPIKLFEYGAMKRAIIAANEAPIAEVITHGSDGLLIRPEVSDLTKAIVDLASDYQLRNSLSESFYHRVKTLHTWQKNVQAIQEDLASL